MEDNNERVVNLDVCVSFDDSLVRSHLCRILNVIAIRLIFERADARLPMIRELDFLASFPVHNVPFVRRVVLASKQHVHRTGKFQSSVEDEQFRTNRLPVTICHLFQKKVFELRHFGRVAQLIDCLLVVEEQFDFEVHCRSGSCRGFSGRRPLVQNFSFRLAVVLALWPIFRKHHFVDDVRTVERRKVLFDERRNGDRVLFAVDIVLVSDRKELNVVVERRDGVQAFQDVQIIIVNHC